MAVPTELRTEYSHAFLFQEGLYAEAESFINLLMEVRILRQIPQIDHALVLDWYKIPPPDNSDRWPNTPAGELVYRAKYYKDSSAVARAQARRELVDKMVSVIQRHPLLSGASAIVTVPGHNADGQSFGEQLAKVISQRTLQPFALTTCPSGPRSQRKEVQNPDDPPPVFAVPYLLEGSVVIVDDVIRSGKSIQGVAIAARKAGAARVFAFGAVKTMRG
ncbi:hypothetical protein [Kribbella sp. NPDC051620]|uniref:hypothetical protein n=1 Tax=Kribbella sp. NPDC051620 TaxID=3364120 RepID=UPI0037BB5720